MVTVKKRKSKKTKAQLSRQQKLAEAVGWCGAASILLAYMLASFNIISVHDVSYPLLNLAGALGILTIATSKHVRQSVAINAFWASMAVIALARIIFY